MSFFTYLLVLLLAMFGFTEQPHASQALGKRDARQPTGVVVNGIVLTPPSVHSAAPIQWDSDQSDPLWAERIQPILDQRWAEAIAPTQLAHQLGFHRAWSRAMDLANGNPQEAQQLWLDYCFVLPAIPGTLTPMPQGDPAVLQSWAPQPVASLDLTALRWGLDPDVPGTLLLPQVHADQLVHLDRLVMQAEPVDRASWGPLYDSLRPDSLVLQGRSLQTAQSMVKTYGELSRDRLDARFGELGEQTRLVASRAVRHTQSLPPSLSELFRASLLAPYNASLVSSETDNPDLSVYFDGQRAYRFALRYPSGLQEDSVLVFKSVSITRAAADLTSTAQYDPQGTVAWQFIGGLKLQLNPGTVTPAQSAPVPGALSTRS